MTIDTWLGVGGVVIGILGVFATVIIGLVGVVVTVWAVWDARRQRSRREQAVIAAHSVIERTYGLLIGIKPFVAPLGHAHEAAVNDGLAAINAQRSTLEKL